MVLSINDGCHSVGVPCREWNKPWAGRRELVAPCEELRWPRDAFPDSSFVVLKNAGVGMPMNGNAWDQGWESVQQPLNLVQAADEAIRNAVGRLTYRSSSWDALQRLVNSDQVHIISTMRDSLGKLDGASTGEVTEVRLHVLRGKIGPSGNTARGRECAGLDLSGTLYRLFRPKSGFQYASDGRCMNNYQFLSEFQTVWSVPSLDDLGLEEPLCEIEKTARESGDMYLLKLHQSYSCTFYGLSATEPSWESELILLQLRKASLPHTVLTISLVIVAETSDFMLICRNMAGIELAKMHVIPEDDTLGTIRLSLSERLMIPFWRLKLVTMDCVLLEEDLDVSCLATVLHDRVLKQLDAPENYPATSDS